MFKATKSFRFIVLIIAIVAMSTLAISANFGSDWFAKLFAPAEGARQDKSSDDSKTKVAPALEDLSENQVLIEQKYDANGNKIEMAVSDAPSPPSNDAITTSTYGFTAGTGVLEDMSSGTTTILGNNIDDSPSGLTMIPFDFWFDGVRANQFSVNANGLMRLGNTVIGTTFSNSMGSTTNSPQLAPYWDDLWIGFNGKVHFKTVGTAPNRKLVVEWQNMQVPRVANGSTGGATFQAWLYETTGVVEYVYGSGLVVNSVNSGYSVGIQSGAATNFAAVTTATGTVSYAAANDTQTGAIAAGTKYTFTPVAPTAPSGLNFTAVTGTSQTLNWTDASSNEAGFLIYRSTDGVNYTFMTQTAANAVSSVQGNLGNNQSYTWKVVAVSEGAQSSALTATQATTAGTVSGTRSVGPTGTYASLTAAFADITTNGLAGNVILELQSTYLSAVETFPIVPSVNGSPSATITVRPAAGATGLSISGTNATAIFDFGGSSYVTIDGQPGGAGGVKDMTISNTNVSGSAVRFINGASSNTLRFLQIRGVSTSTTAGVVNFSTSTAVTGNNNNTITNNDVRDGTTAPVNGVSSTGTTTLGLENNNNTVSNNNIFNFFSATGDHNGLLLGSGNTNWTVSGNSFYNTNGPLNVTTTSVVWNGIRMSSATGSWGHNVTGNFIGGTLPSGGGGALTFTGGGVIRATQLTTGSQISTSLQGNTIGNFNLTSISTATGGAGLGMVTGAYNAGDITPNIVSNWTLNITGAASLWRGISVGTGTAATTVVANNVVSNITCPSTHVAQVQGLGVQGSSGSSGVMTISGNTIGSTTLANNISMSSAAVSFFGIPSSVAWTATTNYLNNTVANVTSTGTGAFNMIGMSISGGGYNISGNTIRNFTTASTTTASTVVGINATATTSNTQFLSQNNIRSLSMTAPAAGVVGFGIIYTGPVTPATAAASTVSRNIVHSISTPSTTTTAALEGIRITAGNATFQNNMVRLGFLDDGTPTSITNGIAINGISETGGTNNIYHNSVYIGGTGVVSASNTTAFFSSLTSGTRAYRDNLFVNNRQNASGTATNTGALFGTALTIPSPSGLTMSNNVYFSFDPAATVRNGSAGTSYSVAGWQGASSVDGASLYSSLSNINFVAPNGTSSTVDLHVASPTVIEGTGVDVGVLDDFDGQTRSGLTPVDVGADAGAFTGVDLAPPVITYTAFGNTTSTSNRVLAITASDATGVDQTATFLPRVYYKRSADVSYVSNQCVSSGGTAQNGTYNCTIDYSLLTPNTASTGDTFNYFAVAQDTATTPNVGSNPGGATGANVNSVTFGGTPNTYLIAAAVSGEINVGTGAFTSLTNNSATTGIFRYLNDNVVTGNVIINVTADLTIEDGAVALNEFPAPFTVTIRPAGGVARTISGTSTGATAMITLNGADRVTFDGTTIAPIANGDAPEAAGDNLTITSANTNTSSAVVWMQTTAGGNGATNNTFKNVNIIGNSNTTTLFAIGSGGPAISTSSLGTGNNNNRVEGCDIQKAQYGIYSQGASAANKNTGNVFTDNIMNAATPNNLQFAGVWVGFEDGVQITKNNISGLTTTADLIGITAGLNPTSVGTTSTTGNEVTNAVITKNNIGSVVSTSATGFTAFGIAVASAASGTNTVANNIVSGVLAPSTSGDLSAGIYLGGATGTGALRVYNNSVSMSGSRGAASYPSYGLAINGTTPVIDVRNNIFVNTQTTSATGLSHAIGLAYTSTLGNYTNLTSNNNDLFVSGAAGAVGKVGSLSQGTGTSLVTLANWNTETGRDPAANSISVDPLFVSTTDLHLQTTPVFSPAIDKGTNAAPINTVVTDDIDGDARPSGSATDIGADEIVTYTVGGTVSGLTGTGLVLQNNAGNDLAISANGAFTFTTALAPGAGYAITVLTQPGGPTQTCTVTNGSGTIAAANVTNVTVTCAANTYTVGGTVSGLVGSGLVLQNNAGDNLPITADGSFTFATSIPSGGSYAVTVFAQPSAPAQTCLVTSGSGSVTNANITGVTVTCTTNTYTIGGTISGLGGGTVTLQNSGGDNLAVGANGAFTFATPVASGATYAVTVLTNPTGPSQTCVVTNGSGTVGGANVTSVSVACTTNTYTIGGTISGLAGGTAVLQNNLGNNLAVAANGAFTFSTPIASGATYSVTVLTDPTGPSQTCVVTNGSGTVGGANVTDVSIACTTNTYTIGGNVTGLNGTGFILQNNGGNDTPITADGAFTFSTPVASGATYAVTVFTQPTLASPELAQTCTVTNGSGTVGAANVTNVSVACTTNNYTVGGTVSGLSGSGLVLQNNGGNNTPIAANGAFTFSTSIASGGSYAVTVLTQPGTPSQTCVVTNGSGTVTNANITNVSMACTTNTYTVGGTVSGLTGTGFVIQNNGGNNLSVAADGAFTFSTSVASGANYAVTVLTQPTGPIQSCAVTNGSGTITNANVTNVTITCTTPAFVEFASATYREDESQTAQIRLVRTGNTSIVSTVQVSTTVGGGNPGTGGTCGTAGVDYGTITNQSVVFNSGDTEAFATVQICTGDTLVEIPDETANLSMSVVSGASAGTQTSAVLRINDTASQFLQAIPHDPINMFFATVANPYPSQIVVAGAPNIVGTMRVTLYDVSHANPDNMDVLLVGPLGQKYLLVADTGGPFPIDPAAPVTLTFSDFAGGHLLDSGAWTTGQFLPTVCESNSVFAPTAPGGPYVTPNCSTPNTLAQTMFGSGGTGFGLTNPNGTWSLYVRDDAGQLRPIGDDAANFAVGRIAGGWGLEFLAPTAADVSIGGRVLTSGGRGIRGAVVTVTGNSLVSPINVMTGVNGRYTVPGLTAGETYVVTVRSRRFFFEQPSRVITLNDNVADADFVSTPTTAREQKPPSVIYACIN